MMVKLHVLCLPIFVPIHLAWQIWCERWRWFSTFWIKVDCISQILLRSSTASPRNPLTTPASKVWRHHAINRLCDVTHFFFLHMRSLSWHQTHWRGTLKVKARSVML